ncbi:MAG: ATP-dependent RNA helicase [Coxiellaceae bacterium]|nr:ATP-dependent RNA helicase [Coxiellaceae bacterium]
MSFSSMGLSESILQSIRYPKPTPIQQQAIPEVIKGRDVMGAAQTGTGKTASFVLPVLERLLHGPRARANSVHALILAPTRELAAQIGESVRTYSSHTDLRSTVVYGGVKINPQMMRLRKGADILVATPGRLLDLYEQNAVRFKFLQVLVLDEADRMLDMGFIRDIRKILAILPPKRQNLLFSATFSNEIRQLAQGLVRDPVEISLNPKNTTVKSVKHWVHPVDQKKKSELLFNLMIDRAWKQLLVFTRTKHRANQLTNFLNAKGVLAEAIHGNKSQNARLKALANFKSGDVNVLVATDVAARGIDIELLPQVVNFDLPNVAEDYVHRIGRTGRAGAKGEAISLVSADEVHLLSAIEHLIKQVLTRELVDDFEPVHDVPVTQLGVKLSGKSSLKNGQAKKTRRKQASTQSDSLDRRSGSSSRRCFDEGSRSGSSSRRSSTRRSSDQSRQSSDEGSRSGSPSRRSSTQRSSNQSDSRPSYASRSTASSSRSSKHRSRHRVA